jgi:diguanylate cyclase (GGDEF)-like protein
MDRIWRKIVLLGLAALLFGFLGARASARPIQAAETCHAEVGPAERYDVLARAPERWTCDGSRYGGPGASTYLRFRVPPGDEARAPRSLVTHTSSFKVITLSIVDVRGTVRTVRYREDQARHLVAGPLMAFALPVTTAPVRLVVARIDLPWTKTVISEARLDSDPEGSGWALGQVVAMAAICGMLLVPLLLVGGIYTVFPQRYVLWHGGLIAAMLVQALFGTGFIHLITDVSPYAEVVVSTMCYAMMAASGLMFAATFLESGRQSPIVRRLLVWVAPLVVMVAGVANLPLSVLQPYNMLMVYCVMATALIMALATMADAWRRGSRLVWFMIAGWTPGLSVAAYRIGCYIVPAARPTESAVTFQLALAFEVLASTIGIVFRFVDLRRERDSATARAIELEGVAGRDALTGLWNRHSIERRFNDLFRLGYRTMAVIDLDHFKRINDRHGHAVGDQVLKVVAAALTEDAEACAIRMGGEEFLLLLRGTRAADRAERCRHALTTRIASAVPGLGHVVTASMGLVEHDLSGTLDVEFAVLYSHCDRLLYEAKRLGRNRTMRERLTGFAAEGWPSAVAAS